MSRYCSSIGLFALALALFCASSAVRAQGAPVGTVHLEPAEHAPGGVHIVTELPDGTLACDRATEAEADALRASPGSANVRLTPLPSLNQAGTSSFRIILRATDQLLARPQALLAFRRAAARWERIIQSPITVVIDVDFGPNRFNSGPYPQGVIASALSAQQYVSPTAGVGEMRTAIRARMTNPALQALVDAIPVPTPSTAGGEAGTVPLGRAIGPLIVLQSLGFRPAILDPSPAATPFGTVPNIGFNSAYTYDFNPNDGIGAGQTDFEAVTAHEIGHTLGFTSAIGSATSASAIFTPWDLYRVRPEAVTPGESYTDGAGWEAAPRVITPGPAATVPIAPGSPFFQAVQVIFDGEAEYETSTARGDGTGGDGQQSSHWRDDAFRPPSLGAARKIGIMDPTIGAGEQIDISAADIRTLELLGYVVDPAPSTAVAALFLDGQAMDIDFLTPVFRGGVPSSGGSIPVVLGNTGTSALSFAFEVVVDSFQPLTPGATPSVTITPGEGSVAAGAQAALALDVAGVAGGGLVYGRLQLRSTDPGRAFAEVPFQISIGAPGLVPVASPVQVSVPAGQEGGGTVEVTNAGDAPLTYVRILEPAASDPETARHPLGGDAVRAPIAGLVDDEAYALADEGGVAARQLAQLDIPGASALRLYDLAQLPGGEIVAVDGGVAASTRFYTAAPDLSAILGTFETVESLGGQVTGIAYNQRTASLWIAVQETGLIREIRLEGTAALLTGRQFDSGITPFGMDYSPELDAFFVGGFGDRAVYAFDAHGGLLPGYPATVEGRGSSGTTRPGLSFTEGLLEMTSVANRAFQAGQFGKTVVGSTPLVLPTGVYGLQRSRTDPNGTLYVTTWTSAGTASIRSLDPPDLPAGVGTRIDAAGPLHSHALLAPGGTRPLALIVDGRGLSEGIAEDELAFLTNAPSSPIVRFPVTIHVMPVANEAGAPDAIDAVATWPNPARAGAQVQLTLSSAASVTVRVYNTLGQCVATLAEAAPLAVGAHALPLPTGDLAAGVYVVRVEAAGRVSTHKVTVVR